MRKRMLIVSGGGNTGKSTSIRLAFELLLKWKLRMRQPAEVSFLYFGEKEVAAILVVGASAVGIATRGDNKREVLKALKFYETSM